MGKYEKVKRHFEEHVGKSNVRSLFREWTDSTVDLNESYLLSDARVATTCFDGYGIMAYGLKCGIYLNVWQGRELVETMYVPVSLFFEAHDKAGETCKFLWPKGGETLEATFDGRRLLLSESFQPEGEDVRLHEHTLTLTREEFYTLIDRLSPLRGYEPPELEED